MPRAGGQAGPAHQRRLSARISAGPQLYAPVTAEDTLSNCCGHLLSAPGLEIKYPEQAERLRQARTRIRMRQPSAAAFGLTGAAIASR